MAIGCGSRGEKGGVVKVSFSAHDTIGPCCIQALVDIRVVKDVAVGENGNRDGSLDCLNFGPIRKPLV